VKVLKNSLEREVEKAKTTIFEEQLQVVRECLSNKNYGAMAIKYNCYYQQVHDLLKKVKEL